MISRLTINFLIFNFNHNTKILIIDLQTGHNMTKCINQVMNGKF